MMDSKPYVNNPRLAEFDKALREVKANLAAHRAARSGVQVVTGSDYVDIIGEGGVTIRICDDELPALRIALAALAPAHDGADEGVGE